VQNADGEYALAVPHGSVSSPGAKIYPMKEHRGNAARHDATGQLIPHSTFTFFTTTPASARRWSRAAGFRLDGAVLDRHHARISDHQHGVERKENALRCGDCHSWCRCGGGPARMNLRANLATG